MKKRLVFSLFVSVILIATTSTTSVLASSTKTLLYSTPTLETFPQAEMVKWYFNEVTKRSGGLLKFKYAWAGSITKAMEVLPALTKGAIDLSDPSATFFAGELPLHTLTAVHIPPSTTIAMDAATKLSFAGSAASKLLEEEAKKNNIKYLMWTPIDYELLTKNPIKSLAELKGLKIRSTGQFLPVQLQAFGAIPITMVTAEWYEGLSRGTIDGLPVVKAWAAGYKLYEVAKYVSFQWGSIVGQPIAINLDVWNSLTPELQNAFMFRDEAVKKFMEIQTQLVQEEIKIMQKNGVQYLNVSKEEQQKVFDMHIKVILKGYVEKMREIGRGKDGEVVLDEYLKLVWGKDKGTAYWEKKFDITH